MASEAAEQRYRTFFDLAPDAYLVTDEHGSILEANAGAAALLGDRATRLIRKPLAVYVDLDSRRRFGSLLNDLVHNSGTRRLELSFRSKRGLPVEVSATVVSVAQPERVLQWILHDLSDYKRAEWEVRALNEELEERLIQRTVELERLNARLETERARLEVLVQQMPAAVVVLDGGGRVELVNRQTEELLRAVGVEPNDFTTIGDLELLREDGTPYALDQRPLVRALEHGEEMSGRRVCVRLVDAAVRMLEVSVAPLRTRSGKITGAVLAMTDISEGERRERSEREFVSNAAHQLRNPLAAIRGAIEVLQAGAKEDPDARDRFLEHIERESARLTRLARSLLLLARAQSHVEEPRREVVPLAPLLYEVAGRLNPPAGVTVQVRCTPDLAAVANSDLLEEALSSLADNAVRYTPRGQVVLACHRSDGALTVEVRDEGPGIPAEVQASIFDRFYRGPGNRQGFGLGLAIAAQAADAIGAKLEIDSTPGKGTAARVVVPAAKMLTK